MKDILFGCGACVLVGLGVFYSPPFTFGSTEIIDTSKGPVVAGTNDEILGRITNSPLGGNTLVFRAAQYDQSRPSNDTLAYSAGKKACRARVVRLDDTRAQVVTGCTRQETNSATSEGFGMDVNRTAIGGVLDDSVDYAFREYVYATLEDRPFNEAKVKARLAGQVVRKAGALRAETALLNERMGSADGKLGSKFCEALNRGEFDKTLDVKPLKAECAAS